MPLTNNALTMIKRLWPWIVGLCIFLVIAGAIIGWQMNNIWNNRDGLPQGETVVMVQESSEPLDTADFEPEKIEVPVEVTRWRVRTETVMDSTCVAAPSAFDWSLLTSSQPLDIETPVLGPSRVEFAAYDPSQGAFERRVYTIEEHPFKYGVEVGAFAGLYGAPTGVSAGSYLGWKSTHVFGRGVLTTEGPGVQLGVRARFGR
jgi:hypothetical protein